MLRQRWIPPVPLIFAQFAFAFSWVLLFDVARRGAETTSFEAFAWIHTIVLAWVTTIALSVLVHVLPNFLDVSWRGENVARASIYAFMLGAVLLIAGFLAQQLSVVEAGALLATVALLTYAVCAVATISQAFRGERLERAVARAFSITLVSLIATALFGLALAFALGGVTGPGVLLRGPAAHAVLGIGGWLTLLIAGVSARTLRPMTGARSRFTALHIGGSSAILVGIILAEVGLLGGWRSLAFAAFIIGALGALAYLIDVADIFPRATTPHVQPRLLMVFGALCSFVAMLFGASAVLGKDLGAAAVYIALTGWVGSAVIAHLHHLGVRLLLTIALGEDDETRPWEVLAPQLTWFTAALYMAAVLFGAIGLTAHRAAYVEIAAASGFLAWIVMVVNVTRAYRTAQLRAARSLSLI